MIQRKETPKDILSFIETYYEEGAFDKALHHLQRARELYPDDLTFLEWEAVFAGDENRLLDALGLLEKALRHDSQRQFALREKASVLLGLGRFEEALELQLGLGPERTDDPSYFFDLGHCFDRIGDRERADECYRRAAEMDPDDFSAPPRFTREAFNRLLHEAIEALPPELFQHVEQAEEMVLDFPGELEPNPFVIVRFFRSPRTVDAAPPSAPADRLEVYKRTLEIEFPDHEVLVEELFRAIAREVSVAFGLEPESIEAD